MSLHARLLLVVLTVVGASSVGACGRHGFGRDDLDLTISKHHIDLRWGRLENAAAAVAPAMRAEFVRVWADRLSGSELQDLEIVGVVMDPAGDKAEVVVRVTYVDRASMTVRTGTITEKWLRTDEGWRLERPTLP